jgi:hypothetical protein
MVAIENPCNFPLLRKSAINMPRKKNIIHHDFKLLLLNWALRVVPFGSDPGRMADPVAGG